MHNHVARCSGCSDIVALPSVKTRSATCTKCLEKQRKQSPANRVRTHHVSAVLERQHLSMAQVEQCMWGASPNGVYEARVGKWREDEEGD